MGSRVRIAAAACVIASGLVVGGAGATMAHADQESGPGGGTAGTQPNVGTGAGATPSPGTGPDDTPGDTPTTEAAVPVGVIAAVPKPTTQVGDGRNGLEPGGSDSATAARSNSKRTEAARRSPSQTSAAVAGEPAPASPAKRAEESETGVTPALPTAAAPDQSSGVMAGEDQKDQQDPKEHQPGFGWPWWGPCPDPDDPDDPDGPGLPPGSIGGGGGGGTQPDPPRGRPEPPPVMQLPIPREVPPELPNIAVDPVIDAATGLATAAAGLPFVPVTLPVIVAPLGVGGVGPGGGGVGGSGAGSRAGMPPTPRAPGAPQSNQPAPKSGKQNPPAFTASTGAPPESFRVGYGNYLRTAGLGQVMAVAIPGVAGILVLTGAGGLLGYRQARAGRGARASTTARFMG